jgi:hypothetical protein
LRRAPVTAVTAYEVFTVSESSDEPQPRGLTIRVRMVANGPVNVATTGTVHGKCFRAAVIENRPIRVSVLHFLGTADRLQRRMAAISMLF